MDYEELKKKCDKLSHQYVELRTHYNKLKKDNEKQTHDFEVLKHAYGMLYDEFGTLKSKHAENIKIIKEQNKEQMKLLNQELKSCNISPKRSPTKSPTKRSPTKKKVQFSSETKKSSGHKLYSGKKKVIY